MKEIYYIANLLAVFNSLGLIAILLFRRNDLPSTIGMSLILLIPGVYSLNSLLLISGNNSESLYFFFFVQSLGALFPSAMYFFVYSMLDKKIKLLNPVFILSFVVGLIPIYYFVLYSGLSGAEQAAFYEQLTLGAYPKEITLYNIVFYGFQQTVFALLLKSCYDFKRKSKDSLPKITGTKITFLKTLLWVFFMVNVFLLSASLLFDVLVVEFLLLPISLIIMHSSMVFYSLNNTAILSKEAFEKNKGASENSTVAKTNLVGIFKLLESSLSKDNEWEEFKLKFNDLNPNYLENLVNTHPNLSKSDIRLLTLISIGYSQKEIANMLAIEPNSVKKAKSRVRKKMELSDSLILNDYLLNF